MAKLKRRGISILGRLRNYFIAGIVVLVPIGITLYLTRFFISISSKLIPNELADVAVTAAPFVAPFSPKTAALMRGIGRFDQRGSISDAVKQGAATFAFGSATRKLGGAENVFGDFGFSSPLSPERSSPRSS